MEKRFYLSYLLLFGIFGFLLAIYFGEDSTHQDLKVLIIVYSVILSMLNFEIIHMIKTNTEKRPKFLESFDSILFMSLYILFASYAFNHSPMAYLCLCFVSYVFTLIYYLIRKKQPKQPEIS